MSRRPRHRCSDAHRPSSSEDLSGRGRGGGRRKYIPAKRLVIAVLPCGLVLALIGSWLLLRLPDFEPDVLADYPASQWITDTQGRPLRLLLGPDDLRCEPISLDRTGQWAAKALVAVEDSRFYRHRGLDFIAITRAVGQNLLARRVVSGASTLSTQVIRLVEPRPRSLSTKLIEASKARGMESRMDKREILEQYMNRAPFGGNLVGIQAASRRYFGRDASDLTLAEAALLMGLPQGPSFMRPDRHPERARERRNFVLWRMEQCGFVERSVRRAARAQPVVLAVESPPFRAPHFADLVVARGLTNRVHGDVRTTLDLDVQSVVEEELRRQVRSLEAEGVHGGSAVLIEVASGAVRALVGSPDYTDAAQGQVNCAYRLRSPGSALKPFAYAMALEQGMITPSAVLSDQAVAYAEYLPGNYSGEFLGEVSARHALSQSLNVPALHITEQVGLVPFVETLRKLGLDGIHRPARHYGLNIVLGTGEVRLVNLANAYAALARGGVYRPVRLLEQETPKAGRILFSPETAYLVADMLSEGESASEWIGHGAASGLPRVAMKTGTSNGLRDAWALAYNPEYVVGVWLGNPDGASSPALVGLEAAAPLAYRILRRLYPNGEGPWFERPEGVGERGVCSVSGMRPGPACVATRSDLYIRGVSRANRCATCRPEDARPQQVRARQAPRPSWPTSLPSAGSGSRPEGRGRHPVRDEVEELSITSPADGTVYRKLAAMPGGAQSLLLRADGIGDEAFWFVDDRLVARSDADVAWPLEAGSHRIVCCDVSGRSDVVRIVVE